MTVKYMTVPKEVEAVKLTIADCDILEATNFAWGVSFTLGGWNSDRPIIEARKDGGIEILTIEGTSFVPFGDWIVKNEWGQFSHHDPVSFERDFKSLEGETESDAAEFCHQLTSSFRRKLGLEEKE